MPTGVRRHLGEVPARAEGVDLLYIQRFIKLCVPGGLNGNVFLQLIQIRLAIMPIGRLLICVRDLEEAGLVEMPAH